MENQNSNVDFNFSYGNFDPGQVETDETINAVFVVDTSGSISNFVDELNNAFNDFLQTMQKSHVAPQLFVSKVEFDKDVRVVSGFQPISNVATLAVDKNNLGPATSLYDAVKKALENAIEYRSNLENSGVNCKTLLFVLTDGDDNNSNSPAHSVKKLIEDFKKEEKNMFTFTSILFGIGNQGKFEKAQKDMGIEHLGKVGVTGSELRKMINFISASISSVSSGQGVATPNF